MLDVFSRLASVEMLYTYLCGHNHLIIEFRTALKLLPRRLCFARASSSWSHQAKSGPLQPGLYNVYAHVKPADDRQPSYQTLVSEARLHPSERYDRGSGTAGH